LQAELQISELAHSLSIKKAVAGTLIPLFVAVCLRAGLRLVVGVQVAACRQSMNILSVCILTELYTRSLNWWYAVGFLACC